MSAPETAIRAAFTQRLKALPGLPAHPNGQTLNGFPEAVAWENVTFTPPVGASYLKPSLLPGEPSQAEQGQQGRNRHIGIYQVSVFVPAGSGIGPINTLRDAVVNHFPRGLVLGYMGVQVTVIKAFPGPPLPETDWVQVPVTIRYRCDAAP